MVKRTQGLPFSTIVLAIIAVLVLVFIVLFFGGYFGSTSEGIGKISPKEAETIGSSCSSMLSFAQTFPVLNEKSAESLPICKTIFHEKSGNYTCADVGITEFTIKTSGGRTVRCQILPYNQIKDNPDQGACRCSLI